MPSTELINNAFLAYDITGSLQAPLIITLHSGRGFGDHTSDFSAYAPLSKDNYRVVSFTYRGHGQSSRTKPFKRFTGADEAAAIEMLKTRLHRSPGLSVSMLQDKIFGAFKSDEEIRLVMHAAGPLYIEPGNFDADKALKRILETVFNAEAHNGLYSDNDKFFDYRDELKSVTARTLVIVGEKDWICPPEQSRTIAEGIFGARLAVVPEASHSVHLEKNEVVLGEIRGVSKA
ncbi:alpha/beta fold hydrolase [Aspergillus undulatus]|uniref:alpha/beta fold hydrolase n=1 Tax=Aspergillus undulatus TaxID=1810928 RepID=UPI003CCD1AA1